MYFPYLRGRQFELIALRELLENNLIGNEIIPIIEPVKLTSTLIKTLDLYVEKKHHIALIMNPGVGDFLDKVKEKKNNTSSLVDGLITVMKTNILIRAYLMKKSTPVQLEKLAGKGRDIYKYMIINQKRDCLDDFLKIYDKQEPRYTLLPDERSFSRKAPNSKVLFEDRFEKAVRNSDYSNNTDQFFSEDHLFYKSDGFQGFSDYSIVGSAYTESGFAPLAVAIHIVYFNQKKELKVQHFVSDSNYDINDPAEKFGEAVSKLVQWITKTNPTMTLGLTEFQNYYKERRYPGLGTVKKLSIMHHLELINKYLEGEL